MILFPIPQGFLRLPKTSWELLVSQEDKRRGTGRTAMTCVTGRASGDVGGRRRLGGSGKGGRDGLLSSKSPKTETEPWNY